MSLLIDIAVSLVPVFLFLLALILLDSFKLIKMRLMFLVLAYGALAAGVSYLLSRGMLENMVSKEVYMRYIAPIIEETLKSLLLIGLIRTKRVGFMVDAAIYGFAIGTGFAFTENIYYAQSIRDANILLWILRGFGTAIMHGGTVAIMSVISKNLDDRFPEKWIRVFLPGLALAMVLHSLFNHFFLTPVATTALLLILWPTLFAYVFKQSEEKTREWLGVNLDADMELLNLINSGKLSDSKIGQYLLSLKSKFSSEVIIDMLCLLRIHTELSVKSKGILMMREAGFGFSADDDIKSKFEEMKYLEKSIGRTGKMAILPFLHTSSQSLWQLYMLKT